MTATKRDAYRLFQDGLTVEQIAATKGTQVTTVYTYLADMSLNGYACDLDAGTAQLVPFVRPSVRPRARPGCMALLSCHAPACLSCADRVLIVCWWCDNAGLKCRLLRLVSLPTRRRESGPPSSRSTAAPAWSCASCR